MRIYIEPVLSAIESTDCDDNAKTKIAESVLKHCLEVEKREFGYRQERKANSLKKQFETLFSRPKNSKMVSVLHD